MSISLTVATTGVVETTVFVLAKASLLVAAGLVENDLRGDERW
jgi:hypothetical protein